MPTSLARRLHLHTATRSRQKCHNSSARWRCTTFPKRSVPVETQCSFFNKMAVHHVSIEICACWDAIFILQQDGAAPRFHTDPCLMRRYIHSSTRWRCTTFPHRSVPVETQYSLFNKMALHHVSIYVCACWDIIFILQQDGAAPRFHTCLCLLRRNVHSSTRWRCTTFPYMSVPVETQCSFFNKMALHHVSIQICACWDAVFILQQDGGAPRFHTDLCLLRRNVHSSTRWRCTTFPYRSVPVETQCSFFNKMALHHVSTQIRACWDAMFILQQDGAAPRFHTCLCLLRRNVHSSTRWRCTTFPYKS